MDNSDEDIRVEIEAVGPDSPPERMLAVDVGTGAYTSHEHDDDQIIEIEDSLSVRRQELKDLRGQLLAIRKTAKSADKKNKKSLQEQTVRLEGLIEAKRVALDADERQAAGAALVMERTRDKERLDRLRAQKAARKAAKAQEEAARRVEAAELASAMPQLSRLEQESLAPLLESLRLVIHPIAPDGSCLFNAIAHQLALRYGRRCDQAALRRLAAQQLQREAEKYSAFLEEPMEEYCEKLLGNDMWGGHLELDALSTALVVPITVYQAGVPPIKFGDAGGGPSLCLCFRKFAYSLGEHYDSLGDRPMDGDKADVDVDGDSLEKDDSDHGA